jgi:hypothetical protein
VEESEYKSTYSQIAEIRCEFEKALTNHKAKCPLARHFWLADREGYACKSEEAAAKCRQVLKSLREKSRFVLKLQEAADKLPHNMEIRVQAGGMQGIHALFHADQVDVIEDIHALLQQAESEYGRLEAMPYGEIVQSVSRFQGRRSRKKSK